MQDVLDYISGAGSIDRIFLVKLFVSLGIVFAFWLIRRYTQRAIWKKTEDVQTRYIWGKVSSYLTFIMMAVLIGGIWISDFQQVSTFLGIITAGIAISLKDIIVNMAGWAFIIIRRPFTIGDRVQVGESAGDVIDVRLFQFTILEIGNWVDSDQSTGRIIHIPNGIVFTTPQANYNKGFEFIWNEIPVLITFESDWRRAEEILSQIIQDIAAETDSAAKEKIKEANKRFMILYTNLSPIVYVSVRDSGILLTARYLCEPRKRRGSEHAFWKNVLEAFMSEPRISLAYPTLRVAGIRGDTTLS